MNDLMKRLSQHKFEVHLTAFLLMILASIGLYFAALNHAALWIDILLIFEIIGNILALITR
jgi:hypothetical protein